jgi:hypothetical protein
LVPFDQMQNLASLLGMKMVQGLQSWIFLEQMKVRKMLQTYWKRQQVHVMDRLFFSPPPTNGSADAEWVERPPVNS